MVKRFLNAPFEVKTDTMSDEEGTFEGYTSTFGGEPDSQGDIVVPGAFKESISKGGRNRTGVVMLWQHDAHNPIGRWPELSEDGEGLFSKGKITKGVKQADEAYLLLKDKAIQHFSIGYDLVRDSDGRPLPDSYDIDKEKRIRYLKRVELWEISLATFASNISTHLVGIKDIENIDNPRELEDFLCDVGLSIKAAKYVVSLASPSLRDADKTGKLDVGGLANVLASLKSANAGLRLAREIRNSN